MPRLPFLKLTVVVIVPPPTFLAFIEGFASFFFIKFSNLTFQYGPLHSIVLIYVQVKIFPLLAYLKSNCVGYHIYSEDTG